MESVLEPSLLAALVLSNRVDLAGGLCRAGVGTASRFRAETVVADGKEAPAAVGLPLNQVSRQSPRSKQSNAARGLRCIV